MPSPKFTFVSRFVWHPSYSLEPRWLYRHDLSLVGYCQGGTRRSPCCASDQGEGPESGRRHFPQCAHLGSQSRTDQIRQQCCHSAMSHPMCHKNDSKCSLTFDITLLITLAPLQCSSNLHHVRTPAQQKGKAAWFGITAKFRSKFRFRVTFEFKSRFGGISGILININVSRLIYLLIIRVGRDIC